MAYIKIAVLFVFFSLLYVTGGYAAFPAKKLAVPANTIPDSVVGEVRHTDIAALTTWRRTSFSERVRAARHIYRQHDGRPGNGAKSNVLGVLSLVFAILSIFSFFAGVVISGAIILLWPLLAIAAIVLGILGCGRKYRGKGLAIAGLALGILSIIGIPVAIILAFTA